MNKIKKRISVYCLMGLLVFVGFVGRNCAPAEGDIVIQETLVSFWIASACRFGANTFGDGCRFL